MQNKSFLIAVFICCMAVCLADDLLAEEIYAPSETAPQEEPRGSEPKKQRPSIIDWGLLYSGSWDEKTHKVSEPFAWAGNFYNRAEFRLNFLPIGLSSRFQFLDRHTFNVEFNPFYWNEPVGITNFTGALYHKMTGSRLLFGVLDEWGLSARIRNPWIRSPPYAENHKPLMADLKTSASDTKNDEAYLYLSTPYFKISQNTKLRGFLSGQTELEKFTPAVSGGIDFAFAKKNALLAEMFYTGKTLQPFAPNTWFSDPPALPEREFSLYGAGILFSNPIVSVSSDFAYSKTFAWGEDIYANFGVTVTPPIVLKDRAGNSRSRSAVSRPLSISLAVDGSGDRFINRDGSILKEGFRGAAKIEWKGRYNSLFKFDTVLRGDGFGEELNRSAIGIYYRFPASRQNAFPVNFTRISFSADRNATNLNKITDSYSAIIGLSCNLKKIGMKNPLGITFSGSLKGETSSKGSPVFLPIPDDLWSWKSAGTNCELFWSPRLTPSLNLQLRSKIGVSFFVDKEEKWDFSFSAALRLKFGRISIKVSSPELPEKWDWTVSWRFEKKEKN